ncbi:MAG: hypothetical protein NVS4B2_27530 [Chloroflexota bacterium]
MTRWNATKRVVAASAAALALLVPFTVTQHVLASSTHQTSSELLDSSKILLKSAQQVNLQQDFVRLPLHRGVFKGTPYWFIITEASDFGLAHDLNVNYAPKLANMAIGCSACVQQVTLTTPTGNKFGDATVNFHGVPDFSPTRSLTPGPDGGIAGAVPHPGAVGDAHYSPFIRIKGSAVVYNAPIVASGDGPFDVDTHSNTGDRVLAIDTTKRTVDILFVRGFDSGHTILYLSTEASDPLAATLERATYVPLLNKTAFLGGDDFLGSARERIFPFINGATGANNSQSQGLDHLVKDGLNSQEASLKNTALLTALHNGGDALNILGDFPSLADPRHANAYSPLWDAQLGQWTKKAVDEGLNTRQTDENQILNLAFSRPDLLTGPDGAAYGSVGFVINCPIIGFTDKEPTDDLVPLTPGAQG